MNIGSRELPVPGTGRIKIDPRSKKLWGEIENEEVEIDKRNWLCLSYETEKEMILTGSGENGFEEAKRLSFKNDRISFCVLLGCQKRGKNLLDSIRLLFIWIPESIDQVKQARAMLDMSEVVQALGLKFFCPVVGKTEREASITNIIEQVTEIRGGHDRNPGRYFFDENVYRLRNENFMKRRELLRDDPNYEKIVQKYRKQETHILRELIATERVYVKCLMILKNNYVEALSIHGHHILKSFVDSMLDPVISVSSGYYQSLLNLYTVPQENRENDQQFEEFINTLDEKFFTKEKISDILDETDEHFKKFECYGAYVSNHPTMLKEITVVISKDKLFRARYDDVDNELVKSGETCRGYASYLIVPAQRIPRYLLMLRELLKHTTEDDLNYGKIEVVLDKVSKLANFVNLQRENFAKTEKLIDLSKNFDRADLIMKNIVKYKAVSVVRRKNLPKKEKNLIGKPGAVYVFEKLLLVVKLKPKKKKKGKKGVDSSAMFADEYVMEKIYWELDLSNPSLRCYKHPPPFHRVLVLEDESRKIFLMLHNGEECEALVEVVQQQISRYSDHMAMSGLYTSREIFKSVLKGKPAGLGKAVKYLHVMSADMKLKVYERKFEKANNAKQNSGKNNAHNNSMREIFRSTITFLRSYSLIRASYGTTSYENAMSDIEKGKGGISDRGEISMLALPHTILMNKKGKKDRFWFYIVFKSSIPCSPSATSKKGKKGKKNSSGEDEGEEVNNKMYFRADDWKTLDVWLKVLGMIGCCRRVDEAEQPREEDCMERVRTPRTPTVTVEKEKEMFPPEEMPTIEEEEHEQEIIMQEKEEELGKILASPGSRMKKAPEIPKLPSKKDRPTTSVVGKVENNDMEGTDDT